MHCSSEFLPLIREIDQRDIIVLHDISRFSAYNVDIVCPYFAFLINERGYTRALFNMQDTMHKLHDVACVLPGHIIHPIKSSEDYLTTIVLLSPKVFKDLQFHTFSHDYDAFNRAPICSLTEIQAQRLMGVVDQLEAVSNHSTEEMPHRYNMLLLLLTFGYECLHFYRSKQNPGQTYNRQTELLNHFCDLVVKHYRESREVKFYADKLLQTAFCMENGMH